MSGPTPRQVSAMRTAALDGAGDEAAERLRRVRREQLRAFVAESNAIEGYTHPPAAFEIAAHEKLFDLETVQVDDLEVFVHVIAGAHLRSLKGLDVRVGNHRPPPGGPEIRLALEQLLEQVRAAELSPWEAHVAYETLHPFTDGNGRSGRALWAWQMRDGRDPFALPFLHRAYYQALEATR